MRHTELQGGSCVKHSFDWMHDSDVVIYMGADFKREFKSLGGLLALIDVPFVALSVSAPPVVQSDIVSSLQLLLPVVVSCSLNRPSIFFSASPIKSLNVSYIFNVRAYTQRGLDGLSIKSSAENCMVVVMHVTPLFMCEQRKRLGKFAASSVQFVTAIDKSLVRMYLADLTQQKKSALHLKFRSSTSYCNV